MEITRRIGPSYSVTLLHLSMAARSPSAAFCAPFAILEKGCMSRVVSYAERDPVCDGNP